MGVAGFPAHSAYTTSKQAVVGMARALAHDGAPFHIRVDAVCPGVPTVASPTASCSPSNSNQEALVYSIQDRRPSAG